MAKKPKITSDLFAKTTQDKKADQAEGPEQDIITAKGVGLKSSEWAELDKIAAELEVTPHMLRVFAVRYFLAQYKAGKVKPTTRTKNIL